MTRTVLVSEPEDCHEQDPHARTVPARISIQSTIDLPAAEQAAADLLHALGVRTEHESLQDTPGRMARAYQELLSPRPFSPTTFPKTEHYDELVLVRDIPVRSIMRAPLPALHRRRPCRLPPRRPDPWTVQTGPRRQSLRGPSTAAGTADEADRRLAGRAARTPRRRRGRPSGTQLHGPARCARVGFDHHHVDTVGLPA
jgi:hypothetical protein